MEGRILMDAGEGAEVSPAACPVAVRGIHTAQSRIRNLLGMHRYQDRTAECVWNGTESRGSRLGQQVTATFVFSVAPMKWGCLPNRAWDAPVGNEPAGIVESDGRFRASRIFQN